MKLLSYNIQYGFGADGRHDLTRAAQVIAGADIAALQEVDRHWQRSAGQDQPALLAAALPDHYTAFAPGFDMAAALPGDRNRRRQFGPMIASRWPIAWTRTHLLPMRRMIDPLNTQSCALEAMIATPLGPLRVVSVHLAHVGVAERLAQIDLLLHLQSQTRVMGGPWSGRDDEPQRNWTEGAPAPVCPDSAIWLGDFNCEPGSAEMDRLLGSTPYHPGARYDGAMIDAAAVVGATYHTHAKVIAGALRLRRLDHCLLTADLAPHVARVWSEMDNPASDHAPLWVTLQDRPGGIA